MIEKNIGKSLQIELVTNYNSNDAHKERLVGGSKSAMGGGEGPYPQGVQIRCDTVHDGPMANLFPKRAWRRGFFDDFFIHKKTWNDLNQIILSINLYSADINGGLTR